MSKKATTRRWRASDRFFAYFRPSFSASASGFEDTHCELMRTETVDYPILLDSNTVTGIVRFMTDRWTIQELVDAVNAWYRDRELQPANGQAASELSVRTLHYYRSSGLLDAPVSGPGPVYGQRHFLQLKAIRILQAHGLPLSRIQQLLFGRPDAELEQIAESAGEIGPLTPNVRSDPLVSQEKWTTYPLNKQLFLVAREGARLSGTQLEAIRKICNPPHKQSSKIR
jgi:DNA-binding transcriptional MerR regulator